MDCLHFSKSHTVNTKGYEIIDFFMKKKMLHQLQALHDLEIDYFVLCTRKYSLSVLRHYSGIR